MLVERGGWGVPSNDADDPGPLRVSIVKLIDLESSWFSIMVRLSNHFELSTQV